MIVLKKNKERLILSLFILPAFVVYFVFQIIPLIGAFIFSISDWNGLAGSAISIVGFDNFKKLYTNEQFLLSMNNLARMVFFSVLFHTPIALLLAVAINTKCRGYRFFKTLFFIPTVFPLTAVGLMWYFVFIPNGAFDSLLEILQLNDFIRSWLTDTETAMNTIIFVNVWVGIGFFMVILLAGLTTIPNELYEAATIDGANSWDMFFNITIPVLKPIIILCIVMDIIGTVKVFDLVFAMTEGGPNGLTHVPTTLLYYESFRYDNYGYGSAIGIILLVLVLVLVLLTNRITKKL